MSGDKGEKNKNYGFVVNKIYSRNQIDERSRIISITKAGERHPSLRPGITLNLIVEGDNDYYYSFVPYSGSPSKGKWKCVAGGKNIENLM